MGGWRQYGIDPGDFSDFLMSTCARLVKSATFNPELPVNLLSASYKELLENKKPILGKCLDFDLLKIFVPEEISLVKCLFI